MFFEQSLHGQKKEHEADSVCIYIYCFELELRQTYIVYNYINVMCIPNPSIKFNKQA